MARRFLLAATMLIAAFSVAPAAGAKCGCGGLAPCTQETLATIPFAERNTNHAIVMQPLEMSFVGHGSTGFAGAFLIALITALILLPFVVIIRRVLFDAGPLLLLRLDRRTIPARDPDAAMSHHSDAVERRSGRTAFVLRAA